jgi:DNA-binding transcriptional ArsR family regulator
LTDDDNITTESDAIAKPVRVMSKLLFGGGGYRAPIGALIADKGGIANVAEISEALGISRQSVSAELAVLRKAGLLEPFEQRDRRKYLAATQSAYWELCRELRDQAADRLQRVFDREIGSDS